MNPLFLLALIGGAGALILAGGGSAPHSVSISAKDVAKINVVFPNNFLVKKGAVQKLSAPYRVKDAQALARLLANSARLATIPDLGSDVWKLLEKDSHMIGPTDVDELAKTTCDILDGLANLPEPKDFQGQCGLVQTIVAFTLQSFCYLELASFLKGSAPGLTEYADSTFKDGKVLTLDELNKKAADNTLTAIDLAVTRYAMVQGWAVWAIGWYVSGNYREPTPGDWSKGDWSKDFSPEETLKGLQWVSAQLSQYGPIEIRAKYSQILTDDLKAVTIGGRIQKYSQDLIGFLCEQQVSGGMSLYLGHRQLPAKGDWIKPVFIAFGIVFTAAVAATGIGAVAAAVGAGLLAAGIAAIGAAIGVSSATVSLATVAVEALVCAGVVQLLKAGPLGMAINDVSVKETTDKAINAYQTVKQYGIF